MSEPTSQPRSEPRSPGSQPAGEQEGLRLSAWNLLLLVPFLMIVTPWFNFREPELFGLPFFYWTQFAWVPVGVVCVAVVYVMTRDDRSPRAPGRPGDVDDLDEGAR